MPLSAICPCAPGSRLPNARKTHGRCPQNALTSTNPRSSASPQPGRLPLNRPSGPAGFRSPYSGRSTAPRHGCCSSRESGLLMFSLRTRRRASSCADLRQPDRAARYMSAAARSRMAGSHGRVRTGARQTTRCRLQRKPAGNCAADASYESDDASDDGGTRLRSRVTRHETTRPPP